MKNSPTPLQEVLAGGVRWHVAPDCRERLLGPDGLRLDEWLRKGQARVVKQGPHRIVYRVALPDLHFYLKHFRLMDTRAWLRELVRPAKARMEYNRAVEVAARRVPTIMPLGLGERQDGAGPGESFLLTRGLDNVEPLSAFLETLANRPSARQENPRRWLAQELGRFIARVHDAGIAHRDLHPGNVLVRWEAPNGPRLYLVDLHDIRLGRPLPWSESRSNLIIFNRWFVLRAGRCDRLRFWRTYSHARETPLGATPGKKDVSRPREIEGGTWRSNLTFWNHRDRRCLVNNRYYQRVRSAVTQGYAVSDFTGPFLDTLLANPDEPFGMSGVKFLKNSPSSTVVELDIPFNGTTCRVVYKRFRVTSWSDPWVALLRRTAALRSWVNGHGLRERCLPTPRPLAVLHRRRHGLSYEGYLLTQKIDHSRDLHQFLLHQATQTPAASRASLRRHIEHVARVVRELHRRHLSHRDLKAANLLIQDEVVSCPPRSPDFGLVWLIDLVGVRRHRHLSNRRRVRDLARLNASFHNQPSLTRTDRLRFLRVYGQWGLLGRGGWKHWWRDIDMATSAKVARNIKSGRPLL